MIHRTIIVPAADVELARRLCAELAGAPGEGMFRTGLASTPAGPATHFVSSGWISAAFAGALSDPRILVAACAAQDPPIECTLAQATALLAASTVSDGTATLPGPDGKPMVAQEDAHALLARLGLVMVQAEEPAQP